MDKPDLYIVGCIIQGNKQLIYLRRQLVENGIIFYACIFGYKIILLLRFDNAVIVDDFFNCDIR